jgi:hypothetical protein
VVGSKPPLAESASGALIAAPVNGENWLRAAAGKVRILGVRFSAGHPGSYASISDIERPHNRGEPPCRLNGRTWLIAAGRNGGFMADAGT